MKTLQLSLLLLSLMLCTTFQAQNRDLNNEAKIEKQLADIDSLLVPTFKAATIAMDANNLVLADSLYSIVCAKAVTFDPALRRLGVIKLQLGKTPEGLALCQKAVEVNRVAYNLSCLASGYLYVGDPTKYFEAQQLLKEAMQLPNGDDSDILVNYVRASFQANDLAGAKEGLAGLLSKYPELMETHYFAAILLAQEEKWKEAKKEILIAKEKGLPQENVDAFLDSGVSGALLKDNFFMYFGIILGIWVVGLFLLYLIGKFFSSLTLKAIENNQLETSSVKPGGWLRTGYKTLIAIGGAYYYISLPIILVLIIAFAGGIIYLFLLAGTIPIKLAIILIIGAVVSIYGMIRSLLIKVKLTDPGRELRREEAPELYQLTDEVAKTMGTRAIEEIRITALNDLAVYETGTKREKRNDKGKRILILGTAVLQDFKIDDFKAVLAHEYGHFTHRDTAGGEIAFRVQNDITNYFVALYNAGQNTIWNIAFHFLRLYNFIFRRISHGATRLQEVLADRVAAETYGSPAFVNGLTHVIRRQVEFGKYANAEIEQAQELKRQINNLYELKGNQDAGIDEEVNKILNSKTTDDDTHPAPADRFRYIAEIKSKNTSPDSTLVTSLFQNWTALTEEMTKSIQEKING